MRYRPPCSVCSKPEAAAVVERMLEQKSSLAEIATAVGIHKSSIHRHSQRCVTRTKAERVKSSKFDPTRQLLWTAWPDGSFTLQSVPANFRGTVGTAPGFNDVVLRVEYEQRLHRSLPNPLTPAIIDEALAEDELRFPLRS